MSATALSPGDIGFRKDYLKIGIYLEQLNTRPQVIALTATAPLEDLKQKE